MDTTRDEPIQHSTIQLSTSQHSTDHHTSNVKNNFITSTVEAGSSLSNEIITMYYSKHISNDISDTNTKQNQRSQTDNAFNTNAQNRPCAQNISDNMQQRTKSDTGEILDCISANIQSNCGYFEDTVLDSHVQQQNQPVHDTSENIPDNMYHSSVNVSDAQQNTTSTINHSDILNSIPDKPTTQKLTKNVSSIVDDDVTRENEPNNTPIISKKRKFQCEICGKSLSCQNSLREHRIVIHLKNGSFKCDTCDKAFPSAPALKKHIVCHTTEKKYTCDTCGSAHKRHSELINHVADMHVENNFLRCEVCFLNFKDKYTLKKHCFDDHADTITTCIICKNKLMTPLSIYHHCLKHSGARHFVCDVCNRAFKTSSGLKAHRVQHDPDRKPYKDCEKCGKSFISRSSYYAHISSHDNGTGKTVTFTCYVCTTTFKHASSLKRHALRHRKTGGIQSPPENPYLNMEESILPKLCCSKCRKIYTSKSGYYSHIKVCRDGIVDSFKCDFCERSYTRRNALNRHLRINHPVVYASVLEGSDHGGDSAIVGPLDGSETVTIEIEPTVVEVPSNSTTREEEYNGMEHLGEVQALFKVALAPVKNNETVN